MALPSDQLCHHYSLADIEIATQNFDDRLVIGEGGFGKVFIGDIKSEESSTTVVAIKRLDSMSNQGAPEFRAEVEMLSKLRHSHLVSLLGCCVDGKEMILVYEYMPHGTVYQHLHKSNTSLSWLQRLKISIGAARGLDYLHTGVGTRHGIIHRDVKSSNILLDKDWSAKISDFGLAKFCPTNQPRTYINTLIKGTFGYLDPEIFLTGKFTRKTDVFAFGVVLFELLSGRHAILPDDDEDLSLARWAQNCVKKRKLDQLVAPDIRGKLSPKSLKEFTQIAYRCLHSDPKERPTMSEVVVALELSETIQYKFEKSTQPASVFGFTWTTMQKYRLQGIKKFSYTDLKFATMNFQNLIRKSGQVVVTKGWVHKETYAPSTLDVGLAISVSRVGGGTRWDIHLLGKYNHPNLVRLLGYCLQNKTLYLVHEFMEERSLEDYLCKGAAVEHSFQVRARLATGVARGLAYLESERLMSRRWMLKPYHIWVDQELNVKLSDFDVAKLIHRYDTVDLLPKDAMAASCWGQRLRWCDVSGLGMVLTEILTGKPIQCKREMETVEREHLCDEVTRMSNKMIQDVVDQRIKLNDFQIESVREMLSLILKCNRYQYTIEEATKELEKIYYKRVTEM